MLRADLNVPAQQGRVMDSTRIRRLIKTIDYLRESEAKIIVLSHFGRPKGEVTPEFSLEFLLPTLKECWGTDITFISETIGQKAEKTVAALNKGDIALLENLRFHKGEEANDPSFAQALAKLGEIYVNDAFSVSHRAHTSTEGIAHLLPSAAGLLMEEELNALERALENPEKPVAAVIGGSKVSTKLGILRNLVEKVDYLILGGAMANTFLFADGGEPGDSMYEEDMAVEARNIMAHAKEQGCKIILPVDSVTTAELVPGAESEIFDSRTTPPNRKAVDIGPKTIQKIQNIFGKCKTLVWNGTTRCV